MKYKSPRRNAEIYVLIDTWWNVNFVYLNLIRIFHIVLIDTWWNVNVGRFHELLHSRTVLIDTWWNVNEPFV